MVVLILQLLLLMLWMCHLLACGWFALGRGAPIGSGFRTRWLDLEIDFDATTVRETSRVFQYIVSFQWALGCLTLGGSDITGRTSWERIFTIIATLTGVIFGGTLVSLLSAALIELKEMNQERSSKVRVLQEYLMQHEVDMGVRIRALSQAWTRLQHPSLLAEDDVQAISALSPPMQKELMFCVFSQHVLSHGLFRAWKTLGDDPSHSQVLTYLCGDGLRFMTLLEDDEVFSTGHKANAAYYSVQGRLVYTQDPSESVIATREQEVVAGGTWLSEATWFCHWRHVGNAVAEGQASLVVVPPASVVGAMVRHSIVKSFTTAYGRLFNRHLMNPSADFVPSDLRPLAASFADLVAELPRDLQVLLGLAAIEHRALHRRYFSFDNFSFDRGGAYDRLRRSQELRDGKSIILLDEAFELRRRIMTASMQIETSEGLILTQIAQLDWRKGQLVWKPLLRIPAVQRRSTEATEDCFNRLLDNQLHCLKDCFVTCRLYSARESHGSSRLSIATEYAKQVYVSESNAMLEERLARTEHQLVVRKGTIESVASSTGRGGMQSEELLQLFDHIRKVYLVAGSSQTGLYVWMPGELLDKLQNPQDITFQYWFRLISPGLPALAGGDSPTAARRMRFSRMFSGLSNNSLKTETDLPVHGKMLSSTSVSTKRTTSTDDGERLGHLRRLHPNEGNLEEVLSMLAI